MTNISFEEIEAARNVLGLPEKATLESIKTAHRRLCKKWHPDKCKDKDREICHEKMKAINKAYRTISKYIENYSYSFAKEKVIEDSPEERWKAQFGNDPTWGAGK